jgi:hypothetical protein
MEKNSWSRDAFDQFQDSIHSPSNQLTCKQNGNFENFQFHNHFDLPPTARAHTKCSSFALPLHLLWVNEHETTSAMITHRTIYPPWTIVECWKNNDMKVIKFYICVIFIVQHNLMCLNREHEWQQFEIWLWGVRERVRASPPREKQSNNA